MDDTFSYVAEMARKFGIHATHVCAENIQSLYDLTNKLIALTTNLHMGNAISK